ncbi:3-deoxy-D-manno-octulosonate cytidylyltransferase [Bernardetia litoralis DSM 6794]|uniref:3-deoxy-manno-octulosonate cytidylyltransferase n=1 Tax=Bernardetia litoralis (strain ATCC 23117 / DSM 6794 / NBRC 15988 / NCIMB 1366 / Fx l1 / Sio-4) TaxID=880071 RepID=I4AQM6_BERLS|nr:3-deoxy-manno-octulosonate cytidylyltransferase [Bernardetia litoralis]AFM06261.1 3-deoxy-D-manno-octulosonate cytidylyltransferase [Bernardetia litoralis DSM 6794]
MKIIAIIPARYASSRFPAKVLADINGKPMIERVFNQAKKAAKLSDVFIATDNQIVFDKVKEFTQNVLMTSDSHISGTDRIAEAALILEKKNIEFDFIINIQGDEPFIQPLQIDSLATILVENKNTQLATLVSKIKDSETLFDSNVVKAIFDTNHKAIYFSRNPIPFVRNTEKNNWLSEHTFYRHIGMYAYQKQVLQQITKLKPSTLELAESLEQLRWIENGFEIQIAITPFESIGIDTPEDLEKIVNK